jgi:hypothetical protein
MALVIATLVGPAGAAFAASSVAPRPTAGSGSLGIELLDIPAGAADDPRARIYIVDHLSPGAVIHRRIQVSNTSASSIHVVLYAAAATIADGAFLGAAGRTADDLSSWTSIQPGTVDVPAGGFVTTTVAIAVPTDAAPGERYGVVWAEVRGAAGSGTRIVEVSRVGIRLYLSVGPGGAPEPNFTIDSLTAERSPDGHPSVVATVHNSGGRALDMSGTLDLLAGPGGLRAGPFPATLGVTLGVGDTEPVRIVLDRQLPAGPWSVQITLRSGLLERTARVTLTFPAAGSAAPVRPIGPQASWRYALRALLALLALLALTVLVVTLRWRLRRRGAVNSPKIDSVGTGVRV